MPNLQANEIITHKHVRNFVQFGGPSPANVVTFAGQDGQYMKVEGVTLPDGGGGVDPVWVHEPARSGQYRLVARKISPPDLAEATVIMTEKHGYIPRQLQRVNCKFNYYENIGDCVDLSDFLNGWSDYVLVYSGALISVAAETGQVAATIEEFHLFEMRGKKVIKKHPLWRSPKVLDIFESVSGGVRPSNRRSETWQKLADDPKLPDSARRLASALVELSEGANDAHWLGKATETEEGISFGKVDASGFIYPSYNIAGSPDRPIANDPNIQNFPRPSDDPRPVPLRSAVIPPEPHLSILSVDFGSVETYTNAIESEDWDRVRAVKEKRVSHEGTADLVNKTFGLLLSRQDGKTVNHAWDKGESPFALAGRLFKVQRPSPKQTQQCEAIYRHMLSEFPKTSQFRDDLWERASQNPLVVRNKFGRTLKCFSRSRYGDDNGWGAKHDPSRKYWCSCKSCAPKRERWKAAIAFLGRSSAVDALLRKMAVIWYEKRLDEWSLPGMEVHDELDFFVPMDSVEKYAKILVDTLGEPIVELGQISLPSDAKWGMDWSACK